MSAIYKLIVYESQCTKFSNIVKYLMIVLNVSIHQIIIWASNTMNLNINYLIKLPIYKIVFPQHYLSL
jgi:hypothetical protein